MSSPSKQKGTAAETEVKSILASYGVKLRRTPACTGWDLEKDAVEGCENYLPVEALATRPDRGEWLITMRLKDFADLAYVDPAPLRIEVKRYKRFALHTIFGEKFG